MEGFSIAAVFAHSSAMATRPRASVWGFFRAVLRHDTAAAGRGNLRQGRNSFLRPRCNAFTSGTGQEPRVMRGQFHSHLGKRLLRETRVSPIRSYSMSGTF
jgi:hypothetical protein